MRTCIDVMTLAASGGDYLSRSMVMIGKLRYDV
jgi:hypothetical protein